MFLKLLICQRCERLSARKSMTGKLNEILEKLECQEEHDGRASKILVTELRTFSILGAPEGGALNAARREVHDGRESKILVALSQVSVAQRTPAMKADSQPKTFRTK